MKLWWLTDFARLASEKAAVEELGLREPWFSFAEWTVHEYRFSAVGIITVHGVAYPVRLIYPDQFPQVPPWVEPQDKNVQWSVHQYGKGGTLCLQLRPDNWAPQATGADMLRSAFNLLEMENPLGEGEHAPVPSAHEVTEIQRYTWGKYPVLIGEGCLARLRDSTAEEVGALRWSADEDTCPVLVFDKLDRASPQHPPSYDLGTLRFELPVWVARVEPPDPLPTDKVSLAAALGIDLDPDSVEGAVLAITIGQERIVPFHVTGPEPDSVFERKWVVLPQQEGVRSGRQLGEEDKKVAIVGLGSVGSKVAESLLRSGVRSFVLVDGDVLFPANLERHTLDWRDVGFRKARAVERRLHHIVTGASVTVISDNLNWQRSARTHSNQIEKIANCDLIVDATGDVPTGMLLSALAAENTKPFVSAEVFAGGIGCMIFRSLPGCDPTYTEARSSYSAFCEEQDVPPPVVGQQPYEAFNEEADPIVADDASVSVAAAHAARTALDILDGTVDKEEKALKLIGLKKGWLFRSHGHVIALDVGGAPPPIDGEVEEQIREFALALLKEAVDAAKASKRSD